ncbi:hypothetical protein GA0070624_3471 [Micromonospora rhizosphaerae]|uniref:Uncharacterized protein n=1 Tax=Micromonospora rhizosphaerae TaxID=568872 RepID=A0A1C6SCS7_9ACTN|nr:hypothetical protein GA0070624_3471 [Micromonospora rhizosphaerae]
MIPALARFPRRVTWAERENDRRHDVYEIEVRPGTDATTS